MPIRWSAFDLAQAMDEVERLTTEAEPFLAEAESKARKATGIANLPQYMDQRLRRLIYTIERRQDIGSAITRIRESIPQDAIEAERHSGKQQNLGLETGPCVIRKRDDFSFWLEQKMNK